MNNLKVCSPGVCQDIQYVEAELPWHHDVKKNEIA